MHRKVLSSDGNYSSDGWLAGYRQEQNVPHKESTASNSTVAHNCQLPVHKRESSHLSLLSIMRRDACVRVVRIKRVTVRSEKKDESALFVSKNEIKSRIKTILFSMALNN